MSCKCKRCGETVFDSKAYLKIAEIERPQQELVDQLNEDLKAAKNKYGKKSEETIDIMKRLSIEKRVLATIWKCKNVL